jgi:hypothetical protein
MYWKEELKRLLWILGIFLAVYLLPLGNTRFDNAIIGTKKTVVYILLVCIMATASGLIFGMIMS